MPSAPVPRSPAAVVRAWGAHATWQQLHTRCTQHALRRALDAGTIVRAARTTMLRSVLDCAATLPFAEGLAVSDSAVREGYLRPEDLLEAANARRGPGSRRALRVATEADGDAANPFESALRAVVLDAGLTGFRPQQRVPLPTGVVHVDLGDPDRRIALEADSFGHGTRAALRDDCRRYNELVRAGWLVLRFAWEHVVLEPGWVGEVVRDAWERRADDQKRIVAKVPTRRKPTRS